MSALDCLIGVGAALLAAYVLTIVVLVIAGRRPDARAWAGFVPDCIVLTRRLLADPRMARLTKVLLGGLVVYLALPIDVIPDFIPIAGHLDDALLVALVLRAVIRSAGEDLIREHWPGPQASLAAILRLAGRESRTRVRPGAPLDSSR